MYDDNLTSNVFIDMAFSKAITKLSWRQSPIIMIIKDSNILLDIVSARYKITFIINGLLFKICYLKSDNVLFYDDEGAIRLYRELGAMGEIKLFEGIDDFDIRGVMHENKTK